MKTSALKSEQRNDTPSPVSYDVAARPIRILHLEDDSNDAFLIKEMICSGEDPLPVSVTLAKTKNAFLSELKKGCADIILCDYRIPGYDGVEALQTAKELCPDTPIIMVTGKVGEERAVETLKLGASDYVLKDRLQRLVSSIRRALNDAAREKERRKDQEALRESQARMHEILESISDGFWAVDGEWRFIYLNKRAAENLGFAPEDLIGKNLWEAFPHILHTPHEVHYRKAMRERVPLQFEISGVLTPHAYAISVYPTGSGISVYWRDITERKRAEEELRRSNQKVNEILSSIQEDFYVLNRGWNFVYASERFTSRVGKKPGDFVGKNIWEMFPKHLGTEYEENLRAAMEKREARRFEVHGKYTDAWYRMAVFPSMEGVTVIGVEITEQKRSEESLRKAKEESELERKHLETILDTIPSAVVIVEAEGGRMSYLNGRALELYGVNYAGFDLGTHLAKVKALRLDGTPYRIEELPVSRTLRTGMIVRDEEMIIQSSDGRQIPVVVSSAPLYDAGGKIRAAIAGFEDITERKKAEAVLRESEERFRTMADSTPVVIWVTNARGDIEMVNRAYKEFFGVTEEQVNPPDAWKVLVHPDDENRYIAAFMKAVETRGAFDAEARVMHRSGEWRWVHSIASPRFASDGRYLGYVGCSPEITREKLVEEVLHRNEENLHLMVEASTVPMIVAAGDGTIEAASNAAAHLFGYEDGDLLGISLKELAGPLSMVELSLQLAELRRCAPDPYTATVRARARDGKVAWMTVEASLVSLGQPEEKYLLKFQKLDL